MSPSTAPKDISDHPKSGSVVKVADVDRKIHFCGVIEAFRQGRIPDNKQIDETSRHVRNTSPVDVDQLSGEGKKLVQDVRHIIETARVTVRETNGDELFQNFVWQTRD
jgi:hypothetical protein